MCILGSIAQNTLEKVFEGVVVHSKVDHFTPAYSGDEVPHPRVQLEHTKVVPEYTQIYQEQLRNIIEGYTIIEGQETRLPFETGSIKIRKANKGTNAKPVVVGEVPGMFPTGSDRGTFANWKATQTIIQGGEDYQHPHSDLGRYDEFNYLDVFPFVALHSFGQEEFQLWVLPQPEKKTFGFLHTFDKLNLVFMRGDFVHAGAVGKNPRGHMAFFPRPAAGWSRARSWWNVKQPGIEPTFLFPKPTFPFGFPSASIPDTLTGAVILTYPVELTKRLCVPLTRNQCASEGLPYVAETRESVRKRKKACMEVSGQSW
jgi:hypothetical protein